MILTWLSVTACSQTTLNLQFLLYSYTNISIRYSEFIGNNEVLIAVSGLLTSIDHSRFINNTIKREGVLTIINNRMISVTQCEFVGNTAVKISLVWFDGVWIKLKCT